MCNTKITVLTILSVQFSCVKYIHTTVQPIFRAVFILQTRNSAPIKQLSIPPSPHRLLFLSMNLTTPGISYKWNHTVFVCLFVTGLFHLA